MRRRKRKPVLYYQLKKLDSSKEHKLESPTGFTVKIEYVQGTVFGKEETIEGVTKVHYCYPNGNGKKRVALFSEIRQAGLTRAIEEIRFIIVYE